MKNGIAENFFLRMARIGALILVAAAIGAPVFVTDTPLGRADLTGRLTPVTGETRRSVDLAVPFARGSAALTAAARRQLDELGAALAGEKLRRLEVGVYGHTDASGPAAYNRKLSTLRAAAAVDYLVERFALDRARFRAAGFGEERPLAGVDPGSPRQRRVEIVVYADGAEETGENGGPRQENGFQAIE